MSFINIIGIALCGFVISGVVKQFAGTFSVYVSAVTSVVLTVFAFEYFRPIVSFLHSFSQNTSVGGYAEIMIKLCAIGAVTSVASDICFDAGESAIASRIELLGKGAAAVTVLPVLENLILNVKDFLM